MKPYWHALTDLGAVREKNEDACFVPHDLGDDSLERHGYLFAVADGMGGHEGGDRASAIAVQAIMEFYETATRRDFSARESRKEVSSQLKTLIGRINHYIFGARYLGEEFPREMGTTLTGVWVHGGNAVAFNVGDSRVYHLSVKNGFRQLTKDHSKTQALVDQGLITAEGAKSHPDHHVITRFLGAGPDWGEVEPDLFPFSLSPGDQLLICSDGLTDMVADGVIAEIMITNGTDLEGNARRMLESALKNGGRDNITLILIQMKSSPKEKVVETDDESNEDARSEKPVLLINETTEKTGEKENG